MRVKRVTLDLDDASLTGFASNVTGATWTLTTTATTDSIAHQVSIKNDSATDHSGKTALLTGTDADDKTITETVTLPAGSATVESTKYFKTLTSIVPSATIGSDTMDIGWVDEAVSQTIPLDSRGRQNGLRVDVTGTIDYTVQSTFDNVNLSTPPAPQDEFAWVDHDDSDFVAATSSVNGNYDKIPTATRIKINSYSSGAAIVYSITTHAGY